MKFGRRLREYIAQTGDGALFLDYCALKRHIRQLRQPAAASPAAAAVPQPQTPPPPPQPRSRHGLSAFQAFAGA